jgi:hypothetical protein
MFTTRFARHRRAKFRAALLHSRGFALHRGIALERAALPRMTYVQL